MTPGRTKACCKYSLNAITEQSLSKRLFFFIAIGGEYMKEIKTRDRVKDIRTLDKAANVAGRMKNAYVRTKEQAEQTQQADTDSPVGYAEARTTESARNVARETGHKLSHQGKRLSEKTRQKIRERHTRENTPEPEQSETRKESPKAQRQESSSPKAPISSYEPHQSENTSPDYTIRGQNFTRDSARHSTERTVPNYAGKETRHGIKTVERGMKKSTCTSEKTLKASAKGSIKTAGHGIKTAERTSRAAIKTTQATAKTAAKTAQTTARASRRAAQTAKAAAKVAAFTVKAVGKAIVATAKAMIAAVKSLIAAIAAGGWIAVVAIVVIVLAASLLGSVFGIFASEEGYDGAPSMPEVVSQLNEEFADEFDSIIADNSHDTLVVDNAGSASMVANWDEVLAVYDVLVATDPENPTEVATLDDEKIEKLRTVFWDMNHISYSVDEVEIGMDEETGEPITETVLTITVSTSTAEDIISYYGLSTERAAQVRELLQPEYAELFQRLTGSYVDITLSEDEIAAIMETLPDDLSQERKEVVLTAYSLLDKVSYFWGGKSLVLGWDSRWGTPMKVTAEDSSTTGTVRSFGLDCSGFVDWVFYNSYNGEYIIGHGGGASDQYSYCNPISWNNAQPGDLVFYPGCEHVGIVVKNEAGTLTVIHCASGYNNVVMTQQATPSLSGFMFVGRPDIYENGDG